METARDQSAVETRSDEGSDHQAAHSLNAMRERARHLLHSQQERIRHFETNLNGQIESMLEHYLAQQAAARQRERELTEQLADVEHRLGQSERSRATLEETLDEARIALSRVSNEQRDLHRQAAEGQQLLDARDAAVRELRLQLAEASAAKEATLGVETAALAELQAERDELLARLDELNGASSKENDPALQQEFQDLQQRFEMAVQEVRELKTQNEQLRQQGNTDKAVAAVGTPEATRGFDWEDQKRRLLEQLESDFDPSDPEQAQEKLTVEGAIRITDQVVAEKEQEIEELKALLKNQSNNLGDVAVGAAAVAEMLDHDELIREERENLNRIKEEWHEKLRKAEVDISVERAKIARERMALEEKLRCYEASRSQNDGEVGGDQDAEQNQQGSRGRWLTRLGLKDGD